MGGDSDPTEAPYLIRFSRRAMACEFEVVLPADRDGQGHRAGLAALDLVDELEAQLTVYRDTSEVSRINATAATRAVRVEPRLFDLLERAVELFHETGGAFDITAGPLTRAWGFSRRQGCIPSEKALSDALALVGSDQIHLDRNALTIRFAAPGVELNLGAIGKGYALDRAAELMEAEGVDDFLLQGGRSSVLARGSARHADDEPAGWSIGVGHPLRPGRRLAEIRLHDAAIATSGSGTQFFRSDGKRYGHILDPRNGRPAEGVYSVTVVAPNARSADALATAFYTLGPDRAAEISHRNPGVRFVMTTKGRSGVDVQVHVHGFEDGQVTLYEEDVK